MAYPFWDDPRDPDYIDHREADIYCDECEEPIMDGDSFVQIKKKCYCKECFLDMFSAEDIMSEFELWETA